MSIHTAVLGAASYVTAQAVVADNDATIAANTGLRLIGFSVAESAGTPAVCEGKVVNGATGAAAGKVVNFSLAASGSIGTWFGPEGIACPLGISIDRVAGTFDITVFYKVIS
jgi:hypothetical protein